MNPTSIMTATHVAGVGGHTGATPPTLELKIKRWVELDNKIKTTAEEVRDIRTEKAVINGEILEIIEEILRLEYQTEPDSSDESDEDSN